MSCHDRVVITCHGFSVIRNQLYHCKWITLLRALIGYSFSKTRNISEFVAWSEFIVLHDVVVHFQVYLEEVVVRSLPVPRQQHPRRRLHRPQNVRKLQIMLYGSALHMRNCTISWTHHLLYNNWYITRALVGRGPCIIWVHRNEVTKSLTTFWRHSYIYKMESICLLLDVLYYLSWWILFFIRLVIERLFVFLSTFNNQSYCLQLNQQHMYHWVVLLTIIKIHDRYPYCTSIFVQK